MNRLQQENESTWVFQHSDFAAWFNETERGLRFGTHPKFQYKPQDGNWKDLDNPMAEQWLDTAKLLMDADTWKQGFLQERRHAKRDAGVQDEQDSQSNC